MINFFKSTVNKILNKFGYVISKKRSGFSLNNDLRWLQEIEINTVFDIGANDGGFAKFISRIFPAARIYSFEPIPECYYKLKDIALNLNVVPLNYALGDFDGESEFNFNKFTYSSSFLEISDNSVKNFPFTKEQKISKVIVKRLDSVINDFEINGKVLVKIDVQGFEDKVLSGGNDFFRNIPTMVVIECSIQNLYVGEPLFDDIYA